jgi:hypothetical protein
MLMMMTTMMMTMMMTMIRPKHHFGCFFTPSVRGLTQCDNSPQITVVIVIVVISKIIGL